LVVTWEGQFGEEIAVAGRLSRQPEEEGEAEKRTAAATMKMEREVVGIEQWDLVMLLITANSHNSISRGRVRGGGVESVVEVVVEASIFALLGFGFGIRSPPFSAIFSSNLRFLGVVAEDVWRAGRPVRSSSSPTSSLIFDDGFGVLEDLRALSETKN